MKHQEQQWQGTITISVPQKTRGDSRGNKEWPGLELWPMDRSCIQRGLLTASAKTGCPPPLSPTVTPTLLSSTVLPTLQSLAKSDSNGIQDDYRGQPPKAESCIEDGLKVRIVYGTCRGRQPKEGCLEERWVETLQKDPWRLHDDPT